MYLREITYRYAGAEGEVVGLALCEKDPTLPADIFGAIHITNAATLVTYNRIRTAIFKQAGLLLVPQRDDWRTSEQHWPKLVNGTPKVVDEVLYRFLREVQRAWCDLMHAPTRRMVTLGDAEVTSPTVGLYLDAFFATGKRQALSLRIVKDIWSGTFQEEHA